MATVAEPLLTAEAYAQLPDNGVPTELVRGRIVTLNMPTPRHGEICLNIGGIIREYVKQHDLGRAVSNDAAVITERGPDSVRGADVAYYSYQRVPRGPLPDVYLTVVPELVFEVRSRTDRWSRVLAKVVEYLEAGVAVVCVVDEVTQAVQVHRADEFPQTLHGDDELTLPDILGDFRLPVRQMFE